MEEAINNLSHKSRSQRSARRWGVVIACAALMAMSSGAFYTASVFFVAIIKEFGWNYASTASIFSLFTVLYGAWGILIGHLVDRFGPRSVVLGGGLLLSLALLSNGSAYAVWHLYVTHSLLTSLGLAATSYVPVSLVLTRRFQKERGLAFGIASAGVGIGILSLVPLTQALISLWGWRVAYRGLAVIASLVILPVGFFALRDESGELPTDEGRWMPAAPALERDACVSEEPTLLSAFLSREFWLVAGTYVFLNGPIALVQTHQVAHLAEMGQPEMFVAGIVGLVGLVSIPGKIGWGFLSDRVWLELIYLAGSVCVGSAVGILLQIGPASSVWLLYGYAGFIGLGYAVAATMNPILSGRFFEGRHFGVILGTLNTFYQGGAAVAIWLAGYAHDVAGSYRSAFLGAIGSVCLAAACAWLAAPRRIEELKKRHQPLRS